MNSHISEELMNACYNVLERCKRAISSCRDLENCKREGTEPCYELPPAIGSCGLVIEACKKLIERIKIHLDHCTLNDCLKRMHECMKTCDMAITQCEECIQNCLKKTEQCAHFSQKSVRTCEDVLIATQKIIDHL